MRPTCLVRGYTTPDGYKKFPQGKIIKLKNNYVYYRDIYKNKSKMYKDKETLGVTVNIDHKVLDWLELHGIKHVYYNFKNPKGADLKLTTLAKIKNSIKRGEAFKEKLNNHTQIFLPVSIFELAKGPREVSSTAKAWIAHETDVNRPEKIEVNYDTRLKLKEIWQQLDIH